MFIFLGAATCSFALGYLVSGQRWHRHYAAEIQRLQQEWAHHSSAAASEALTRAGQRRGVERAGGTEQAGVARSSPAPTALPAPAAAAGMATPREILARIRELHQNGGPNSQRAVQRLLSDLVLAGPQSLEAIKEVLAAGEDPKWDAQGKGKGGSLRRELLQVVQEIGGEGAEQLLAQVMSQAASPQEMLRLAQALEKMAPGKYQQAAVAAASAQLAHALNQQADPGPFLEILGMYGDRSYVEQARAILVQADGRLNKDALDYLQKVLHQDVVPLAQQLAQDPRLNNPKSREELARLAVEYVGMSEQANQLWYQSALNPELQDKAREKLIQELEKKGFQDRKNPTAQDVQLAQVRLQILEALRAQMQGSPQLPVVEETRLRLAAIADPNLRPNQPAGAKANKPPR